MFIPRSIVGTGPIVEKRIGVVPFDAIEVWTPMDVHITIGETRAIVVHTKKSVLEWIDIRVWAGVLQFGLRARAKVRDATIRAEVSVPDIQSIAVSGSSRVTLRGTEPLSHLRATVSDASRFDAGGIKVMSMDAAVSGKSLATVSVLDRLTAACSGNSILRYRGSPREMKPVASGDSTIEQID